MRRLILRCLSLCVVALLIVPTAVSAAPPLALGIKATPIGQPTWRPADAHLFSGPVGTAESGYEEFLDTLLGVLPPPNHVFNPFLTIGPGAPHQPPYTGEIGAGIAGLGLHEGVHFTTAEFSGGNGVFLAWMNVPAPGSAGSSPDFASGPVIPNTLFPIHVTGTDRHNGAPFSGLGEFDVPPLDANLEPPFDVDGHSHLPIFFADAAEFGPAGANLNGVFRYEVDVVDASGAGWHLEATFTVGG